MSLNFSGHDDKDPNKSAALEVLEQWIKGIRIEQVGHFRSAASCNTNGIRLGLPVTVLSIITGTSIFVSLSDSNNESLLILAGIVSMVAAAMSGMHNYLKYSDLGIKHYTAGVELGKLRKRAEEIKLFGATIQGLKDGMKEIREENERIQKVSPGISQKIYDMAHAEVREAEERHAK